MPNALASGWHSRFAEGAGEGLPFDVQVERIDVADLLLRRHFGAAQVALLTWVVRLPAPLKTP